MSGRHSTTTFVLVYAICFVVVPAVALLAVAKVAPVGLANRLANASPWLPWYPRLMALLFLVGGVAMLLTERPAGAAMATEAAMGSALVSLAPVAARVRTHAGLP